MGNFWCLTMKGKFCEHLQRVDRDVGKVFIGGSVLRNANVSTWLDVLLQDTGSGLLRVRSVRKLLSTCDQEICD